MKMVGVLAILVYLLVAANIALADSVRGINIDFVTIGNAGNGPDPRTENRYGSVDYDYRIGKYEITNVQWDTFTSTAGAPTGNLWWAYDENAYFTGAQRPANNVSWYEAVQFCNFLTSGDKSKGAYQFTGDNTNPGDFLSINRTAAIAIYGTIYVLPTENEWYKAAYYKPDGSGYSLYANGQNTVPAAGNGWNYGSINPPWDVGTGTQEQNGTFDIMGNVIEWNETAMYDGSCCVLRGGSYWARNLGSGDLASYTREGNPPDGEGNLMGFRIASIVPEPCSAVLFALGGLALLRRKRFV